MLHLWFFFLIILIISVPNGFLIHAKMATIFVVNNGF